MSMNTSEEALKELVDSCLRLLTDFFPLDMITVEDVHKHPKLAGEAYKIIIEDRATEVRPCTISLGNYNNQGQYFAVVQFNIESPVDRVAVLTLALSNWCFFNKLIIQCGHVFFYYLNHTFEGELAYIIKTNVDTQKKIAIVNPFVTH